MLLGLIKVFYTVGEERIKKIITGWTKKVTVKYFTHNFIKY